MQPSLRTNPLQLQKKTQFLWLVVIVLLAGFAIQILLYSYHGLEGDDTYSLSLSRLPLETLVPGLMAFQLDIHPPLHFLLVKGWTLIAGESLLSLRLLNILMDAGIGALLVRFAGRALSRPTALVAVTLWSTAPLLLASDLLVRMYTLLALLTAGGITCVVEAEHARGWRRYALYAIMSICALAAMYTHMIGFVVTGMLAVGVIVGFATRFLARKRVLNVGAQRAAPLRYRPIVFAYLTLIVAGLLSLPYAQSLWALYQSGRPLGAEINPLGAFAQIDVPEVIFSTLLTGRAWVIAPFLLSMIIAICIVLVAVRYRTRALSLLAITVTGIGAMMALALVADLYKPRYLAPFVAPLLAILAGVILLPKRTIGRMLLLLIVVSISGAGLLADFDRTLRDDWTAAAQFVELHEQAGDVVIAIPDWGGDAFRYHYRGTSPVHSLLPGVSEEVDLDTLLTPLVEGKSRVWYIWYQPLVSDPDALADGWFRSRAVTMTEVFPSGIQVKLYDFDPQMATLPETARPLDAQFGDQLALRGVFLPVTEGSARDQRLHPPSTWVQVILYWESLQPSNAIPRVRLTDGIGQVFGGAVERDNDLLVRYPVSTWQPGTLMRAAYDLNVNPDTLPGVYNIEVMVLDAATGQPLPSTGNDAGAQWVIAGQFVIK